MSNNVKSSSDTSDDKTVRRVQFKNVHNELKRIGICTNSRSVHEVIQKIPDRSRTHWAPFQNYGKYSPCKHCGGEVNMFTDCASCVVCGLVSNERKMVPAYSYESVSQTDPWSSNRTNLPARFYHLDSMVNMHSADRIKRRNDTIREVSNIVSLTCEEEKEVRHLYSKFADENSVSSSFYLVLACILLVRENLKVENEESKADPKCKKCGITVCGTARRMSIHERKCNGTSICPIRKRS